MEDNENVKGDEKMKASTIEAVDALGEAVKDTTLKFFTACVERTTEIYSEWFDGFLNKTKEQMKKGGKDREG